MILDKNIDRGFLIKNLNPVDKGKYYIATCPSCGKRELYVYKNKDFMVCNRLNKCGYINNIISYLKDEEKLNEREIFKLILDASIENRNEEQQFISKYYIEDPKDAKMFKEEAKGLIYTRAINYLKKRNIPENNINKLGYILKEDGIYIYIPFYEENELVFYTLRSINKNAFLRWKDLEGVNKHEFVYNLNEMYNTNTIFIFEGLMCALSLKEQVGTAMLTNNIGKVQAQKIMNTYPENVVLVPDIDKTGLLSIKKNIKILKDNTPNGLYPNFYIYYVDIERKNKIFNILNKKYNKKEENYLLEKLDGFKDFNETGKNYINLDDCELEDKRGVFKRLDNFFKTHI